MRQENSHSPNNRGDNEGMDETLWQSLWEAIVFPTASQMISTVPHLHNRCGTVAQQQRGPLPGLRSKPMLEIISNFTIFMSQFCTITDLVWSRILAGKQCNVDLGLHYLGQDLPVVIFFFCLFCIFPCIFYLAQPQLPSCVSPVYHHPCSSIIKLA